MPSLHLIQSQPKYNGNDDKEKKIPPKKIDKICVLSAEKNKQRKASNDVQSVAKKENSPERIVMTFSQATTATTTNLSEAKKGKPLLSIPNVEHFRRKDER